MKPMDARHSNRGDPARRRPWAALLAAFIAVALLAPFMIATVAVPTKAAAQLPSCFNQKQWMTPASIQASGLPIYVALHYPFSSMPYGPSIAIDDSSTALPYHQDVDVTLAS